MTCIMLSRCTRNPEKIISEKKTSGAASSYAHSFAIRKHVVLHRAQSRKTVKEWEKNCKYWRREIFYCRESLWPPWLGKRQSGVAVSVASHLQCSAIFSRGATRLRPVRRKFTHVPNNRCIFVHMVGRDTSHSCVIMKFIYHYTWSRQIIFNSQKLVKRRWTVGVKERNIFITALLFPYYRNQISNKKFTTYIIINLCTSSILLFLLFVIIAKYSINSY